MKKDVFNGKTSASVSVIEMNANALSAVEGGSSIVSKNVEVSLINPSTKDKYDVSGLTSSSISITIGAKTSASNKILKCKYYDSVADKYVDTGLVTVNKTVGTNQYEITCQSTHLTTFAVSEENAPTSTTTGGTVTTNGTAATFIPISGSIMAWSLSLIALLIALLV